MKMSSQGSKWDSPETSQSYGAVSRSSLEAAAEAAAKVNAMLIAKGKLKPSQLSNAPTNKQKSSAQGCLIVAEVDINDVPINCRNLLTRGSTQDDISKMSGAAVSTRGRYMTQEELLRNPGERPLYLCVQASLQDSVNKAISRIHDIIDSNLKTKPGTSKFTMPPPSFPPPTVSPGGQVRPRMLGDVGASPPPPLMSLNTQPAGLSFVQDKIFIGLEHAPPSFDVKGKVSGPMGSYLNHIQQETGAKVTLRGKGSGTVEAASGREAFEAMHIHIQHPTVAGLTQAKQLAANLIETVQQDYAQFQQTLATLPPTINPGTASLLAGLPPHQPSQNPFVAAPVSASVVISQPPPSGVPIPPPTVTMASLGAPQIHTPMVTQTLQGSLPDVRQVVVNTSIPPPSLMTQPPPISSQPDLNFVSVSLTPGSVTFTRPTVSGPMMHPAPQGPPMPHVTLQPQPGMAAFQPGQPPPGAIPTTQIAISQPHYSLAQPEPAYSHASHLAQPLPVTHSQVQIRPQYLVSQTMTVAQPQPPTAAHQAGLPQPVLMQHQAQQVLSLQPTAPGQPMTNPMVPTAVSQPTQIAISPQKAVPTSQTYYTQYVGSAAAAAASAADSPQLQTSDAFSRSRETQGLKRRFTEEKQEEKLPENLLGYQHGPPHLANLVNSQKAGAYSSPSAADDRSRLHGQNGERAAMPPPPPPPLGGLGGKGQSSNTGIDKQLMPPPPPPPGHEVDGPPEAKKMKGALGSVAAAYDDDD